MEGGDSLYPFRMGEYWYIKIDGRLIQCESYEAAWNLMEQ